MGFLSRFGVGGVKVDTILDRPTAMPGGGVTGQVRLQGGKGAQDINSVRVSLEANVEVEHGDGEWRENVQFATQPVAGRFKIAGGQTMSVPFSFGIPWECPITTVGGWHLRGMSVGVRTRVDISGAADPGDLDPIAITPLPVQGAVLDALSDLGFRFKSADLEKGRIHGSTLPFYQEVEFAPPMQLVHSISELEVTFLADPHGVDVVLEADRRGGFMSSGGDSLCRFRLSHADTDRWVLAGHLEATIRQLGQRRGWRF